MIKELIIDLRQVENVLLYKVIQQDESFTGNDLIFKSECVNIYSNYYKAIEVCGQKIFLHINGTSEEQNCLVWSEAYTSIGETTEIKAKIEKCVVDFNEHIRKENEKSEFKFYPEEVYYYINDNGTIHNSRWKNRYSDEFRYNSKNAFKTREEAERKLEILNFIYENQTIFTEEQWKDKDLPKYIFCVTTAACAFLIDYTCLWKNNKYYFKDRETAQKVADFIGYDDYMKYL